MDKNLKTKFVSLQDYMKNSFTTNTDLDHHPEDYILKECLGLIYTIFKNTKRLKYVNVYCTSCLYFMSIIKNKDFLKALRVCKKIEKDPQKLELKKYLIQLALTCIQWAFKINLINDGKVNDLIMGAKSILKPKKNCFWNTFEITDWDMRIIEDDLRKCRFLNPYFMNFLLTDVTVNVVNPLKAMIKQKLLTKEIDNVIAEVYNNPLFCLFSTFDLCLVIALRFRKSPIEQLMLSCVINKNNAEQYVLKNLISGIKANLTNETRIKKQFENFNYQALYKNIRTFSCTIKPN